MLTSGLKRFLLNDIRSYGKIVFMGPVVVLAAI